VVLIDLVAFCHDEVMGTPVHKQQHRDTVNLRSVSGLGTGSGRGLGTIEVQGLGSGEAQAHVEVDFQVLE